MHQIHDSFFPRARELRSVFDRKFRYPLLTHSERFVWDYWHVPGEYTLLRTPAHHYFPPALYSSFHNFLVKWGREYLGCHDVSPPWLSCYVEGCRQEKHQDVPHGPIAFVYSLSKWQGRKFSGGETFLRSRSNTIEAKFNRLILFNPSVPHGVTKVRGTHNPAEGRLVVHGWFVNPRPFWVGPLSVRQVRETLDNGVPALLRREWRLGSGLLSVRLSVSRAGKVVKLQRLVDTRIGASTRSTDMFIDALKTLKFPAGKRSTRLTLPLMME